jgi:AcrR family transcriptional regulator
MIRQIDRNKPQAASRASRKLPVRTSKSVAGSTKGQPAKSLSRARALRSNQEMREVSVDRIYHSALKLFVEQGYRSTTIDEIAAGAGLTKGGVYFYISKKEHLMAQMLDDISARYIDDIITKLKAQDLTAQEKLVAFMHSQVTFALENPEEVMLLVMSSVEFSKRNDALTEKIDAIYERMREFILMTIKQGLASKSFATKLHPIATASFYVATHDGMMLEWYRRAAKIDGTELVRVFREVFLRALS